MFLVPIKFLHKKMHFQLRVFNLVFVLHTTKSHVVAELLLEGGESKLNMLEVSTRCWQNHRKVTSKLRSLWYPDCSSKKHSWEIGSRKRVGGEGERGWVSLSRPPVLWRQRRDGKGFTEGVHYLLQSQNLLQIDRKEGHRHRPQKHPSSCTGKEAELHCQRPSELARLL